MNQAEMIEKVSKKSGILYDVCEKVIKAFEKQSQEALAGLFKGKENSELAMLSGICEKSGISMDICDKILTVLDDVMEENLKSAMKGLKKKL